MGGCGSKADAADPDDVTIVSGGGAGSPGTKKPRKTHSGYNTDIGNQKPALSEVMEKENTESIDAVYDRSNGTVLGRGACGSVEIVKKRSTGDKYAMKTVSLE